MNEIWFDWNEDTHTTTCVIQPEKNGPTFVGEAICHSDDYDMESTHTGQEIAYKRAKIKHLQHICKYELKPQIATLKHLSGCMSHSTHFNPKSYENKMLQRQIRLLEFDLTTAHEMIQYERESLKEYIDKKDDMYKRIRRQRAAGQD